MGGNSFILDFNLLEEQGLSLEEFVTLINIYRNTLNSRENLVSLQTKQFVKLIDESIILREKGNILLELVSIDKKPVARVTKKKAKVVNNDFSSFIDEFRALWRGLKPGSMGAASSCKEKMLTWTEENPNYTKEDIMKAAKIYIASLNGDYFYLQRADYFISKVENGVSNSRLSAFIDEIDQKPVEDWTTKLS